jgi:putative ABC transport system ATP-binding protein
MADRIIYIKNGSVSRVEQNAHPFPVEQLEW